MIVKIKNKYQNYSNLIKSRFKILCYEFGVLIYKKCIYSSYKGKVCHNCKRYSDKHMIHVIRKIGRI